MSGSSQHGPELPVVITSLLVKKKIKVPARESAPQKTPDPGRQRSQTEKGFLLSIQISKVTGTPWIGKQSQGCHCQSSCTSNLQSSWRPAVQRPRIHAGGSRGKADRAVSSQTQ